MPAASDAVSAPRTPDGKLDLSGAPDPVTGDSGSEIAFRMRWDEHGYPGEFVLRRYHGSGLLYNSPRLDGEQLSALYGRNYYFFIRPPERELRRMVHLYARGVKTIENQVEPRRVLDVGCGRGYFPALLGALGWDAHGVEISDSAADWAKRRFGLDVFTGTIEQYADSDKAKQYPLVTAVDVIEHVPDPASFVSALFRTVAPGGRVIVDTPNADSANIAIRGTRWHGFNPFHIYLFNGDNLSRLLERHGFVVETSYTYTNTPVNQPGGEPPARKVRNVVAEGLRKVGLLPPVFRLFYGLKKRTVKDDVDPQPALAAAVELARQTPAHHESPDAVAPLAGEKRGDNLVVIARRPA